MHTTLLYVSMNMPLVAIMFYVLEVYILCLPSMLRLFLREHPHATSGNLHTHFLSCVNVCKSLRDFSEKYPGFMVFQYAKTGLFDTLL